jgi:hypothetical protein
LERGSGKNLSSERFAPIKSAIFEEFSNFLPFLSKKNEKISIFALKFPVQCDIIIVNCIKCLWKTNTKRGVHHEGAA